MIWFWMGMVCGGPVMIGLLVAVMVEVFFFFFVFFVFLFLLWLVVVSGCGGCGWMWMWRFLSFCCDFFFSFFVSGGCGMGGGFLVGGWYCDAGGAMRKREIEEREENKKNY